MMAQEQQSLPVSEQTIQSVVDPDRAIEQHRDRLKQHFPMDRSEPPKRTVRRSAIATVLLACAAAGLWEADPAYRTEHLETGIGEQRKAELNDGSRIALNTATKMRISWHLRSRRVNLEAGQALFDVSHKIYRPFSVAAGVARVEVVGTMFDVWRQPGQVDVTVLRGTVKVAVAADVATLTANQQVTVAGDRMGAARAVEASVTTTWQDGQLVFNRVPLRDALIAMQRYSSAPIAPVDADVGSLQVSGVFAIDRADTMLNLLPTILPVAVTRGADGTVRISRSAAAAHAR